MQQGAVKNFFLGSAKIAVAISLSIVVLALLGWGAYELNEYRIERKNSDLAQAKTWPITPQKSLGVSFKLKTKWRSGSMQYQFEVNGISDSMEKARKSSKGSLNILFIDGDGFDLASESVKLITMSTLVNSEGKDYGLEAQGKLSMSAEDYRRVAKWNVGWQGFSE